MIDGIGTHTYAYNSLSRLTSETQYISDLNASFTLSYQYNLAGELKSITDPWNATINYGFDASGRLAQRDSCQLQRKPIYQQYWLPRVGCAQGRLRMVTVATLRRITTRVCRPVTSKFRV